jgi:hypothetical protein
VFIETPVDQVPPIFLFRGADWDLTDKLVTGVVTPHVWFYSNPAGTWRMKYLTTHLENATTVAAKHENAIGVWAASFALDKLANYYREIRDPSINADGSNYRSKGDESAARAKRFRAEVAEYLQPFELDQLFRNDARRFARV